MNPPITWSMVARALRGYAEMADTWTADFLLFRVESQIALLTSLSEASGLALQVDPILETLTEVTEQLTAQISSQPHTKSTVGRPSLNLSVEAVENYLLAGLTVREVAEVLEVSERTVHRLMAQHGTR